MIRYPGRMLCKYENTIRDENYADKLLMIDTFLLPRIDSSVNSKDTGVFLPDFKSGVGLKTVQSGFDSHALSANINIIEICDNVINAGIQNVNDLNNLTSTAEVFFWQHDAFRTTQEKEKFTRI